MPESLSIEKMDALRAEIAMLKDVLRRTVDFMIDICPADMSGDPELVAIIDETDKILQR
jgi:hypothetical protein